MWNRWKEKRFLERVFDNTCIVHDKEQYVCPYEFNSKKGKQLAHWSPAFTKDYRDDYSFKWKNRYRIFTRVLLYLRARFA